MLQYASRNLSPCSFRYVSVPFKPTNGLGVRYLKATTAFFHKFYPPTGIPEGPVNDDPWDYMDRPKRRQGQLAKKLEHLVTKNDFYTIFTTPTKTTIPKQTRPVPEIRDGMTVETFLKTIGRGCEDHVDKFESWEQFFTMHNREMKEKGIKVRQRRWIRHWHEKYRQGDQIRYIPLRSKAARNKYEKQEWRMKLITQKALREELGI